jgi:lipid-A-disaccharide synthase-like uncharacterized protein
LNAKRLHLLAWILFLICGVFYLIAAIRDRDPLLIAGSVCFVVAVAIFLLPASQIYNK